jgi:hypothetical protein
MEAFVPARCEGGAGPWKNPEQMAALRWAFRSGHFVFTALGPIRLGGVTVVDIDQLPSFLTEGRTALTPQAVVHLANAILRDGAVVVSRSLGTD